MRNQHSSTKLLKLLGFIFITLLVIYIIFSQFAKKEQNENQLISPLSDIVSLVVAPFKNNSLKKIVQNSLEGTKGTYGIVIKNLNTGEFYALNEHRVYEPGSLYKIWVMATAIDQIRNGKLKGDEELSGDIKVLNDKFNISSESAELTEGTITFTVNQALQQMITISHNYASLLLTEKIKLSSVKAFLQREGFNESIVGTDGGFPTSTPSDIALFFEKLYKGELANPQDTSKMLDLLKKQKLNDKLPKYLPSEAIVAHKTGEIDFFTHDGGIVYGPKSDYIIVVLSKSDLPAAAEERIADISKKIYDYFEN